MRRRLIPLLSILLFLFTVTAVSDPAVSKTPQVPHTYRTDFGFPQYEGTLERKLARNVLDVSFDLYRAIGDGQENCFFSPYSISMGLGMLWYGARGTTADEIARVLHLSLSGEELQTAYIRTTEVLEQNEDFSNSPDRKWGAMKAMLLDVANGCWVQDAYPLRNEYIDTMQNTFDGEVANLDFIRHADESRTVINSWVEEKTGGMIDNLIPKGTVTPETRLVLGNTVRFEAQWLIPFVSKATRDSTFHRLDGSTVKVPFMHKKSIEPQGYMETPEWQAAEFFYRSERMAMLVILPRPGKFAEVEQALGPEMLEVIDDSLRLESLEITFPKFSYTSSSLDLKPILNSLGMKTAFTGKADFRGMTTEPVLSLGFVFHKASVTVNEFGTVAAAATSLGMLLGTPPPEQISFIADRPFIYIIRDLQTRMVLFIGRMVDPS